LRYQFIVARCINLEVAPKGLPLFDVARQQLIARLAKDYKWEIVNAN